MRGWGWMDLGECISNTNTRVWWGRKELETIKESIDVHSTSRVKYYETPAWAPRERSTGKQNFFIISCIQKQVYADITCSTYGAWIQIWGMGMFLGAQRCNYMVQLGLGSLTLLLQCCLWEKGHKLTYNHLKMLNMSGFCCNHHKVACKLFLNIEPCHVALAKTRGQTELKILCQPKHGFCAPIVLNPYISFSSLAILAADIHAMNSETRLDCSLLTEMYCSMQ